MSDISDLMQSFKGDIVTPADADYKDAIARWAANAERPARIVAFVKDTPDITLALRYARDNHLKVAIRCGGHSGSGSSSAKDGLVVDLSRYFNYAIVDPDSRTARVGGGAIWDTVENEAIKHKLATVAGTVSHTGVSGLLLGGGYGFLTGQYGLVVDNLLQATIVTADGTMLTLSETENADLFWGICGAGSNFGVCTEFVLRLHPQHPTAFSGLVVFPAEVLSELMTVLIKWWKTVKKNEAMQQILGRNPLSGDSKECITLVLFYNGSEKEGRENFKEFYNLKPIFDGAREIPFEKVNSFANKTFAHGMGYYLKSVYQSNPSFGIVDDVLEKVIELNAAPGNEIDHVYMFEYIPPMTVVSRPEDATAHLRSSRTMTGCALKWTNNTPSTEKAAKRDALALTGIVAKAEAKVSGEASANTGYGNYSSETQSEIITTSYDDPYSRALFGPNYFRLQRLKAQYDPKNVFFRWFPIRPDTNAGL